VVIGVLPEVTTAQDPMVAAADGLRRRLRLGSRARRPRLISMVGSAPAARWWDAQLVASLAATASCQGGHPRASHARHPETSPSPSSASAPGAVSLLDFKQLADLTIVTSSRSTCRPAWR